VQANAEAMRAKVQKKFQPDIRLAQASMISDRAMNIEK
jgi:hypothetical protein